MQNRLNIKDVDFNGLDLVKKSSHGILTRQVFYDKHNDEYIKTWNKDYYWNLFVNKANIIGIYKNLTLLKNLLYDDEGNIRGYISKAGILANTLEKRFRHPDRLLLENADKQNKQYQSFMKRLYRAMDKKSFVYLDLIPNKLAEVNGKYYLFDIEPLVFIEDLSRIHTYKRLLFYCPDDYRKKTQELIKNRY